MRTSSESFGGTLRSCITSGEFPSPFQPRLGWKEGRPSARQSRSTSLAGLGAHLGRRRLECFDVPGTGPVHQGPSPADCGTFNLR